MLAYVYAVDFVGGMSDTFASFKIKKGRNGWSY